MDLVEVEGLRIAYARTGSGPPVALAHGFVADGLSTWASQIDALIANAYGIFGMFEFREVHEFEKFWAIGSGKAYALGAMYAVYETLADGTWAADRTHHAPHAPYGHVERFNAHARNAFAKTNGRFKKSKGRTV